MGRNPKNFTEVGVAGGYDFRFGIRTEDTIVALRGQNGIKRLREMRENDPTVGAILIAIDMLVRGAEWVFRPADSSPAAADAAKFAQSCLDDMDFTFEEFLSDVTSMLPYGFSLFEMVFKRRADGRIGVRKLGPRAQWTIELFDVDSGGVMKGAWQQTYTGGSRVYLPADRVLLFRTTSANCDPAGRSILRNAYRSYLYATHITEYEAVAIERELNGLPVGRIPSEYLMPNASPEKKAFADKFRQIMRDVKKNAQGSVLLPSDLHEDEDGKLSDIYQVGFELLASKGSRDIDTSKVIMRHQGDIARTVIADFMMLGQNDRGSYALGKSKSDIFVKGIRSFLNSIASPINRKLLPALWEANGMDPALMPKIAYENVAPVDIDELGKFVRSLALAGAQIFPNPELENAILSVAGLPERILPTGAARTQQDDNVVGADE
jgi:hypothetical protein